MKKKHGASLPSRRYRLDGQIDHDYLHKLTPEEASWLEAFDASYYHGRPSAHPGSVSREVSRERENASKKCLYGRKMKRVKLAESVDVDESGRADGEQVAAGTQETYGHGNIKTKKKKKAKAA